VETLTCRLLPFAAADGPTNMAADEALLASAQDGAAALRFYTWAEPTASLGYFQPAAVLQEDAQVTRLPWLRRPSGGLTLVHHHEVTYALALPPAARWDVHPSWVHGMHHVIAAALQALGVTTLRLGPANCERHAPEFLCFHHFTCGDLLLGNAKVVGSAQRKQHGALLQHGAILLARSEHTPTLPGIAELSGRRLPVADVTAAVCREFAAATGWRLHAADWTAAERLLTAERVRERFARDDWNHKR
jgi:lipoate-protein ligase A